MSHIHYKFQSSNEHDTITFDGLSISLSDLRSSIHQKAKLSQSDEYALQITNAQTKEGKWQGIGIVDHHRHVFHSYGSANIPLHVVLFFLLLDWHHSCFAILYDCEFVTRSFVWLILPILFSSLQEWQWYDSKEHISHSDASPCSQSFQRVSFLIIYKFSLTYIPVYLHKICNLSTLKIRRSSAVSPFCHRYWVKINCMGDVSVGKLEESPMV